MITFTVAARHLWFIENDLALDLSMKRLMKMSRSSSDCCRHFHLNQVCSFRKLITRFAGQQSVVIDGAGRTASSPGAIDHLIKAIHFASRGIHRNPKGGGKHLKQVLVLPNQAMREMHPTRRVHISGKQDEVDHGLLKILDRNPIGAKKTAI